GADGFVDVMRSPRSLSVGRRPPSRRGRRPGVLQFDGVRWIDRVRSMRGRFGSCLRSGQPFPFRAQAQQLGGNRNGDHGWLLALDAGFTDRADDARIAFGRDAARLEAVLELAP